MTVGALLAVAGGGLTLFMFLAGVVFGAGGLMARVRSLEEWRVTLQHDMHEISDVLGKIQQDLSSLRTWVQILADHTVVGRVRQNQDPGPGTREQ